MKPLALLLSAIGLGSVAAARVVTPPTAVPQSLHIGDWTDWSDERPGPDSARVAILLGAMGSTDAAVCEMLSDQLGNFWFSGGEFGIGRLADARVAARAARDSLSGRLRDPAAIALVTARLASDDPCVRRTAARLLGRSTAPDAALARLATDANPRIREAGLLAIGTHDRPDLRTRVESALTDREAGVRAMAAWALGSLEDRASVDALTPVLRDPDLRVRTNAAWALGTIEDPRAVSALLPLLRDADVGVRATTAEALGDIEAIEAAEPIEQLLERDADRRVRFAAVEALGQIEAASSAEPLARVLEAGDAELAVAAADALGSLDNLRRAPAALMRAASASDP
ncbi:MAG: HEAT repeat domain-containing protein, partial [Gemmatimonadales bacterium]|nr:HEAT repeat domain-containing protein [Gemmatimonadales bacterium]